ncbi:competence protein CoiA family protein [Nostoc sp. DedSLP03]|uniref:competence protein CoiA family protein n=1 Tax=Nostoc sp. DedSLP03 TaxID=3075400 RepID=UPI002AD50503|nr:competence protein CoiA family protein [Nostoc sp. DedSLP03]
MAMWLKYGVDEDGILICIEDIDRGKTLLKCPYCNGELTAKKGKVKEHHFAHNDQTCRPIANREFPTLPLYDNFNIQLSSKDLAQLKLLWKEYGAKNYPIIGIIFDF